MILKKRNLQTIPIDPLQQHNSEEDEELKVEDPPISNDKISIRNGEGAGEKGRQVCASKKQKNPPIQKEMLVMQESPTLQK